MPCRPHSRRPHSRWPPPTGLVFGISKVAGRSSAEAFVLQHTTGASAGLPAPGGNSSVSSHGCGSYALPHNPHRVLGSSARRFNLECLSRKNPAHVLPASPLARTWGRTWGLSARAVHSVSSSLPHCAPLKPAVNWSRLFACGGWGGGADSGPVPVTQRWAPVSLSLSDFPRPERDCASGANPAILQTPLFPHVRKANFFTLILWPI